MLTIRREQMAAFEDAAWQRFEEPIESHFRALFTVDFALLGEERTRAFVRRGIKAARERGAATLLDARRYTDLLALLGSDFHRDPQLPWAAAALAGSGTGRFATLHREALDYLDAVNGHDGKKSLRAVLRLREISFEQFTETDPSDAGIAALLQAIHPDKLEALANTLPALLALADQRRAKAGLARPRDRPLWVTLMAVLGSGFDADPLQFWAGAVVAGGLAGDARLRALCDAGKRHLEMVLELLRTGSGG